MASSDRHRAHETAVEPAGKAGRDGATSAEIRARLGAAETRFQEQMRALRQEMSLRDVNVGHSPLLDHVRWHPFLAVGLTAGTVALLTLVISLLTRSRAPGDEKEQWTRALIADLLDDAATRIRPDEDGDAALRRALRRRAPVIFVETPQRGAGGDDRGPVARLLLTATKAALGFGGKLALDYVTTELTARAETPGMHEDRRDAAAA